MLETSGENEQNLSKMFDVVDSVRCLKFKWLLKSPKTFEMQVDSSKRQKFSVGDMKMKHYTPTAPGKHVIKLFMTTMYGIERIEECSHLGM